MKVHPLLVQNLPIRQAFSPCFSRVFVGGVQPCWILTGKKWSFLVSTKNPLVFRLWSHVLTRKIFGKNHSTRKTCFCTQSNALHELDKYTFLGRCGFLFNGQKFSKLLIFFSNARRFKFFLAWFGNSVAQFNLLVCFFSSTMHRRDFHLKPTPTLLQFENSCFLDQLTF